MPNLGRWKRRRNSPYDMGVEEEEEEEEDEEDEEVVRDEDSWTNRR